MSVIDTSALPPVAEEPNQFSEPDSTEIDARLESPTEPAEEQPTPDAPAAAPAVPEVPSVPSGTAGAPPDPNAKKAADWDSFEQRFSQSPDLFLAHLAQRLDPAAQAALLQRLGAVPASAQSAQAELEQRGRQLAQEFGDPATAIEQEVLRHVPTLRDLPAFQQEITQEFGRHAGAFQLVARDIQELRSQLAAASAEIASLKSRPAPAPAPKPTTNGSGRSAPVKAGTSLAEIFRGVSLEDL